MTTLELIRQGFETWYNSQLPKNSNKVSIITNYSDEQSLALKAYHKITIKMAAVRIKDGMSYTITLIELTENYNHGLMTEQEAEEELTKKFIQKLFDYCKNKQIIN